MRAQKLRTSLTVIGIAWGTVAVVVLLAFGVGLERQTIKRFHGLGDRIVILFGGRTTKPFAGFGDGRPIRLRPDDVQLIADEVAEIEHISPEFITRSARVRRGVKAATPAVTGIVPASGLMRNDIVYRARTSELTKVAERRVYETMGRKYRFDPTDKDALGFWDTSEWETKFGKMFVAFNIFFAIVGSFTLLVGGIGVANIMYIVVRERTREIGVRRAVGATRADIMRRS